MPLRWTGDSQEEVDERLKSIHDEQDVYRRLSVCDGVVPCISISETTIQFAWMQNGDLRTYLSKNRPSRALQLSWFRQMANALANIHARSVLVADLASRNFLLDSNLSIKLCDFSESTIAPLDADMETFNDDGYSIQTDIGQLGAIFYEVVTGKPCSFDVFYNLPPDASTAVFPPMVSLPSTQGLWLGEIIERCWSEGGFQNATSLLEALSAVRLDNEQSQKIAGSEKTPGNI